MIPFESFDAVSHLHFTATMVASSAVSTQCKNVTDAKPDTAGQPEPRYAAHTYIYADPPRGVTPLAEVDTPLMWL